MFGQFLAVESIFLFKKPPESKFLSPDSIFPSIGWPFAAKSLDPCAERVDKCGTTIDLGRILP
jgi:hypothetical protein